MIHYKTLQKVPDLLRSHHSHPQLRKRIGAQSITNVMPCVKDLLFCVFCMLQQCQCIQWGNVEIILVSKSSILMGLFIMQCTTYHNFWQTFLKVHHLHFQAKKFKHLWKRSSKFQISCVFYVTNWPIIFTEHHCHKLRQSSYMRVPAESYTLYPLSSRSADSGDVYCQ